MDHDHSGHHMPMDDMPMPMCSMNMLWNSQVDDVCVVFESWHIKGWMGMLLSCFAVTLISILYASLLHSIRRLDLSIAYALHNQSSSGTSISGPSGGQGGMAAAAARRESRRESLITPLQGGYASVEGSTGRLGVVRLSVQTRLLRAGMYAISVAISFWLMLVAMTYNTWLFLSIVIGAFAGHVMYEGDMDVGHRFHQLISATTNILRHFQPETRVVSGTVLQVIHDPSEGLTWKILQIMQEILASVRRSRVAGMKTRVISGDVLQSINDLSDGPIWKMSLTQELPNNVPFASKVQLIHHFTKTWPVLAHKLLSDVLPIAADMLKKAALDVFKPYADGNLVSKVQEIINERVDALNKNTLIMIDRITTCEHRPYTQNDHYLNDMRGKILTRLKEMRYSKGENSPSAAKEEAQRNALANLAECGYEGLTVESLSRLRPTDEFEEELSVMAETRAYWQLAYKIIDLELIVPVATDLHEALKADLGIFTKDSDFCRNLLAETPYKVRLRAGLKQRRQRLERAKQSIKKSGV